MSPFGKWPDFDSCLVDMQKDGKSEDSAKRICGSLKAKLEGSSYSEVLSVDEATAVKMALSIDGMVKYTIDEIEKLCPSCYTRMKAIGLKEVSLPASYFTRNPIEDLLKGEILRQVKIYSEKVDIYADIQNVEIFKSGKWNGDLYTEEDLNKLVSNFEKLKDKQSIPVKIGHSENQEMLKKEGLPAAGWVSNVRRVGSKLVADIRDMPEKIANLVAKKAYKKISAEIYPVYRDGDGVKYNKVLRAIALLGGDIPAVEGLNDVVALSYSDNKQLYKVYTEVEEPVLKFVVNVKGR